MDLNDYQERAALTDQRPRKDENDESALVFPLVGLASEVGSLITQYKKRVRDGDAHEMFTARAAEELGDILWYLSNLAGKLGLDLAQVADLNLRRIGERWPSGGLTRPLPLLDDTFPPEEQLPRVASVTFKEVEVEGAIKVQLIHEGRQIGNYLTDMNYDDDGYRFHDAFHLTYAALLGWSPVTRAFFNVKRNSQKKTREVEDGGRAVVIEEGISAFVFDYARREQFLAQVPHLDYELLRTVVGLVEHLEVRRSTAAHWEQAILRSYEIWRGLRHHRGGTVHFDMVAGTINLEPPHR